MPRKLSLAEQWMRDHPDDEPCPKSGGAAYWWRMKRGIGASPKWAETKRKLKAMRLNEAQQEN
jgi:hypothetical protein